MATVLRSPSATEAARTALEHYLEDVRRKPLLRFITCGSVDDGKSTLIGRLLFDSKQLFEDQLAALQSDSRRLGGQEGALDFALLVDGLGAEREQGITIDVAYRFFSTARRKFIVADTPGHEQYTRNMATGASTADLAILLVDAEKGILTQTRRHSFLAKLLGIGELVLAVNKMDLVDYSPARFEEIVADYRAFAAEAGIECFSAIPLSGLAGENVTRRSGHMPWYSGPTLLEHLEDAPSRARPDGAPFRMAVQWVNRPDSRFRGYCGRIASGSVRPGDRVTILPSGHGSRIARIVTGDGDLELAVAGQSVTLTFAEEVDCARGDIIAAAASADALASGLEADLVWMSEEPLASTRSYLLKMGARTVSATVAGVDHVVDVNRLEQGGGRPLELNDIGRCRIELDRTLPIIPYAEDRELGGFILIDRLTHATVAAGMVRGPVERGQRPAAPADRSGHILWIRAASSAERGALAVRARERLRAEGTPAFVIDESVLRDGLNRDLGETEPDRKEKVRRAREVARLMSRAGCVALVAMDVDEEAQWPGRAIGAADLETGAEEWVI